MSNYIKKLNIYIPEKKLYRKNGNIYFRDTTYEEAKAIVVKFAVPTPLELKQTPYMEQTYSDIGIYRINKRDYVLKKNRNSGEPYLHEV